MITFFAPGHPAPQGSKRIGRSKRTGRPIILEDNARTKPWRQVVATSAQSAMVVAKRLPFVGPVSITLEFVMPRPKRVKFAACDTKPDIDKLSRAALDALTGPVLRDDSQVVRLTAFKRYVRASGIEAPGALISISQVERGVA